MNIVNEIASPYMNYLNESLRYKCKQDDSLQDISSQSCLQENTSDSKRTTSDSLRETTAQNITGSFLRGNNLNFISLNEKKRGVRGTYIENII